MPSNQSSGRPTFENAWRKRFEEFAAIRDDDAGIAGWSSFGLETRLRAFLRFWSGARAGELWLDAGCGAGTYTRSLAMLELRVVGVDYSLATAIKAKARDTENCMWGVADVTRLPLRPGSFDGVICFGVLQALSQSEPAIAELSGRLRSGGGLWVDALNAYCLANLWVRFSRWLRGKPRHLRYESPKRIKRLMKDVGLLDVRIHWIPIMPARLRVLQPVVEGVLMSTLLRFVPGLGVLLSHSFIVAGRRSH